MSLPPSGLLPWALNVLPAGAAGEAVLQPLAGDASQRRYFRLQTPGHSYMAVDSPPATQKNREFLAIRQQLETGGVRVPRLLAADIEQGYMLLEDLGDRLLQDVLTVDSVDDYYRRALVVQRRMAHLADAALALPAYDNVLLAEELARFPQWFVTALLGLSISEEERTVLAQLDGLLIGSALAQPRVLVHRDFHSRNLMCTAEGQLAVIDFQDAVRGPATYDAVSLLKDCYLRWPRERVVGWAMAYRDALCDAALLPAVDDATFLRWFDWMGLQRHLKVLGTFARLALRDGKTQYLQDLPLVVDYVQEAFALYAGEDPALDAAGAWFEHRLLPVILRQPWSRG